jgi:hypothetical protein
MKNLPNDWYESSMRPLREEAKTWPEWMKEGVREARDRSERRSAKYAQPSEEIEPDRERG